MKFYSERIGLDYYFIISTIIVIGISTFIYMDSELKSVEALETSFPPTPAIKTIYIFNNGTIPNSTDNFIEANVHDFLMAIGTDNSIIINITEFTP